MSDYIFYIDQTLINEARKDFESGDFLNAGTKFQKALDKLREYNGDSMHPIYLASELVQKIDVCKNKTGLKFF
jgi:hypothetical protein